MSIDDDEEEIHWRLMWRDLAPSTHPFDLEKIQNLIERKVNDLLELVHGKTSAITPDDRWRLIAQVESALLVELGAWMSGWTWVSEEQGGPIQSWNDAFSRSVFQEGELHGTPTVGRLLAPLVEWRGYLEELEKVFDDPELPNAEGRTPAQVAQDIELAGARILPIVLTRTAAYRTWYDTFTRAMVWYLEAKGHDPQLLATPVSGVVMTRFDSWVEPSADAATACFSDLGARVLLEEERANAAAPKDALLSWLSKGRRAIASFKPIVNQKFDKVVMSDAQRRYVHDHDRIVRGDPNRADAMEVALDLCRESVDKPLSFDLLRQWQEVVLGRDAPLRTTDAFAKKGRERYGTPSNLRDQLEACLAEANSESTPLPLRAARVYLDVLFFHPFSDGNARSARLALDHTVTRAGLALQAVDPIFALARSAHDESGPVGLATIIQTLLAKPA